MANPTHTYVDYATGNDYKGASFVNGSWVNATLTLSQAGNPFGACKVGHWLYVDDNGSGEVATGYYRITNIGGIPGSVVLHADIRSGVNDPTDVVCVQATGAIGVPWRTTQGALDLITRDAVNGDQVNVKAGTAMVAVASHSLTTYGTPAAGVPLIFRGYTAAANDGGMGEIDMNGTGGFFAVTTHLYVGWVDLEVHSFGNANGVYDLGAGCFVHHCEVHKGASAPVSRNLVGLTSLSAITGSWVHDAGTSGVGIYNCQAFYNYVKDCPNGINVSGLALDNIVVDCTTIGIGLAAAGKAIGNSVYSSTAATGSGITAGANVATTILNNIIEGYSGVGGEAILATGDINILGYNAFFNNTANNNVADVYVDLTANDVACAASPFTNAAAGNFEVTTEVQALGFPGTSWYGPAATDNYLDIGAVQRQEVACDYPAVDDVESGVVYASGAMTGEFVVPAVGDVESGVTYGHAAEFTGTFTEPGVGNVETGVTYGAGGVEFTGTFDVPAVGDVDSTAPGYGAGGAEFAGTLVQPAEGDVRLGTTYGAGGVEFTGTLAPGGGGMLQANKRANKQA